MIAGFKDILQFLFFNKKKGNLSIFNKINNSLLLIGTNTSYNFKHRITRHECLNIIPGNVVENSIIIASTPIANSRNDYTRLYIYF